MSTRSVLGTNHFYLGPVKKGTEEGDEVGKEPTEKVCACVHLLKCGGPSGECPGSSEIAQDHP